jgi:cytochrome c oxidase subunit 3
MSAEPASPPVVPQASHFGSDEARSQAAHVGMWVFLATEVLLFAALFTAYAVYRVDYPETFRAAREHMKVGIGTANTYLLVTSSICVAFAVWAVRQERTGLATFLLLVAVVLGLGFLTLKGVEYAEHVREGALPGRWYALEEFPRPGASLYFTLYFLLTGVHALHVLVGVSVLAVLTVQTAWGKYSGRYHTPLELGGMYWHLVDIIWLFVWPLLYLV